MNKTQNGHSSNSPHLHVDTFENNIVFIQFSQPFTRAIMNIINSIDGLFHALAHDMNTE